MRQLVTTPAQVGEILRGRRKARGTSQAELAGRLGISQGRLSTLEANPTGMTLERFMLLTKLLGLEIIVQDRSASAKAKVEW